MKYGNRLRRQIEETLPEWRNEFIAYKDMKKYLKTLSHTSLSLEEARFICLLNAEIEKINNFFLEQEEDFIIRQKELQDRIQSTIATFGANGVRPSETEYEEAMAKIRKDMVNFHGEMVLLENYSNVNYTGLGKILKKYDKKTGRFLRLPFIEKVLGQPFLMTDLLSKLIKECEKTMQALFPVEGGGNEAWEESIFRNTVAALVTIREMRRGSSTYSPFSLPPIDDHGDHFSLYSLIPIQ
ncbi:hypothetical protein AMTRI_Chr13g83940 [Amborella trichopoda]|uniref:SPX domain-containing protein n=1 Tax=Amborella trichopoda TaxID=13333 RepID=W1P186_AMBTC|nr:SPX domain-containing protein 3 [Amborella trichopoda]ERN00695.1 hypothetical protein AMTR_s00106p00068380 [Amborella trichopoda]|eukprot:XP_006838126.1 SPX domain-containing protein 3 [Amborella trichopoda]